MRRLVKRSSDRQTAADQTGPFDMEAVIGSILLVGILLSLTLIVAGLAWHWALVGHLQFDYTVTGVNLFQFVLADVRRLASGAVHPQVAISTGVAVLMLTPYVRVLASMLYFALVEHNWKYTLFTGFVLGVLTYSLFLR
jgi:uncharacterized membrane protein